MHPSIDVAGRYQYENLEWPKRVVKFRIAIAGRPMSNDRMPSFDVKWSVQRAPDG